jgi:uncharacterized protein YdeI (YjbR/CyaY-like superfamily)
MTSPIPAELPIIFFPNPEAWEKWLAEHHSEPAGIWLKLAKKASPVKSVTYDEALDVALCYGWIDSQLRAFDEFYKMQKFTPRRSGSVWSKRNVDKIAALTKAGRMKPAGLAAVEVAKQNNMWQNAYSSFSTIEVPADFQTALDAHPKAAATYSTLTKTNTYAILWRIETAKKPETRRARIEKSIAMLEAGEAFHPQAKK